MKNIIKALWSKSVQKNTGERVNSFYDLTAVTLQGKEVCMNQYRGKTILVVNTASKCGLTYQYEGLQELHEKYKDKGLVVLGFPCNQFGNQEPGDEKSIEQGCVLNYGVTFDMFSKVDVNGKKAHPIFKFLKEHLDGFGATHIKWNFTKFIVDTNGVPVKRFSPTTKPKKVASYLKTILAK